MFEKCAFVFVATLVLVTSPLVTTEPATSKPAASAEEEVLVLDTSLGTMVFRLFAEKAPKTTAQIKRLAREGFYDGKVFYRVVAGHVIQTGDGGVNDQPAVPLETGAYPHVVGALGLARDADPDSGSTEIYVCHAPRRYLDEGYAVFGLLIEGFDVLETIATVPVEEKWDGRVAFHRPKEPVTIDRAYVARRVVPPLPAPE